jgi:pimeloyl-ACP methyl ester carboxylesterase
MGTYVDLNGVNTWYDESGSGEPVVLLHPGGADSRAFGPNVGPLAARFHVFTPDRRGHGRTSDVEGPISYELMAQDAIAFLEMVVGQPADVVGMSDGAIVGLFVALKRPDLVPRLAFVAGVFDHEAWAPGVLDTHETPDFFVESYAEVSPDGRTHFPVVAAKLARMHESEPTLRAQDLSRVSSRTLVMVGDDDEVKLEHAIALYRSIPDCELAVVPGTSHGLLVEKPDLCNRMIIDFLTTDPVPTIAPIRRRGAQRSDSR